MSDDATAAEGLRKELERVREAKRQAEAALATAREELTTVRGELTTLQGQHAEVVKSAEGFKAAASEVDDLRDRATKAESSLAAYKDRATANLAMLASDSLRITDADMRDFVWMKYERSQQDGEAKPFADWLASEAAEGRSYLKPFASGEVATPAPAAEPKPGEAAPPADAAPPPPGVNGDDAAPKVPKDRKVVVPAPAPPGGADFWAQLNADPDAVRKKYGSRR